MQRNAEEVSARRRKGAREPKTKTNLVPDHWVLLGILQHTLQDGKCPSILDLSQAIRELMSQERRLLVEPCESKTM